MGQRLATFRAPSAAAAASAERRGTRLVHFKVRCDEISPEMLERVAAARVTGTLARVVVECRGCAYDEPGMEALERAAGLNKLVLSC